MKNVRENKQMFLMLLFIWFLIVSHYHVIIIAIILLKYLIHNMIKYSLRVLFTQPRVRSDLS